MSIKTLGRIAGLVMGLWASLSLAQAPQLELLHDGNSIIGLVNTAQGAPAVQTPVVLHNLSRPQAQAITLTSDDAGVFFMTGEYATQYRATVEIDGQSSSASVTLSAAPPQPWQWPPIYITLAILGLLSLIPAHFLRRDDLAE